MNAKVINAAMFVAGVTVGSIVTWKLVEHKYAKRAQEEIESVKETYSNRAIRSSKTCHSDFDGDQINLDEGVVIDLRTREKATLSAFGEIDNIEKKKQVSEIVSEQGYKTDYTDCFKPEEDEVVLVDTSSLHPAIDPEDEDEQSIYAEREGDQDAPYVISPEEFGEIGYETISLTYYADEILADEMDELVESIDSVVGLNSLTTFGEYEDDSVFVRNDKLKCDYEILKDQRRWADIVNPPKPKGNRRATAAKRPHQMEE